MTASRRNDLIALAILAAATTALFFDVLAGTHNVYMRDLTRYYYPAKQVMRDIVDQGEFPWWNRAFGAGQPMAANPEHEAFYPLTWLILLPDFDLGYRLQILLHIYIGLFGMYALLRSMRLRAVASSVGAASFALGGLYLSWVNLLPILYCAAWLPFTCLYARRFMLQPTLRSFSIASMFLGLQLLVGEPTTVLQTGTLLGMYALYRGWRAARDTGRSVADAVPEMLSRVAFVGLMSVAASGVGSAQLLPAIDHVGDSARSVAFDFSLVSNWSMPWAKLAELVYPNFLGHISIDRVMWYWGGGLYPGAGSPFLFSIYCGLLVAALAAAAIFVRPRGGGIVLAISVLSLAIALGGHTPLLRLLYEAGIATSIRYPEKFVMMAIFATIILAAKMLQQLLDGDEKVREAALGFVAATFVVAAFLALASLTSTYDNLFMKTWGLKGKQAERMIEISRNGWIIASVRAAALFAILWWARSLGRKRLAALLALFVAADLAPVVHQLNPRMPARFFLEPPAILRQLEGDRRSWRIFHEADWYGQEDIARRYFSSGAAVYWVVRNGLFPMLPPGHGVSMAIDRDYDKTALLPTIDFVTSVWDVKRSGRTDWWKPFVAMANVRYRGVYKPFDEEKKRVKGRMEEAEAVEFQEVGMHPRYYFADQVVKIANRQDFVRNLSDGGYGDRVAFVHADGFAPARGIVERVGETPNAAMIDVHAEGRAFLVMSVTPHKYWRVEIDGRKVDPLVTNIGFQGIIVPAGRHRITMEYGNPVAATGIGISTGSLLLLAWAAIRRRPLTSK